MKVIVAESLGLCFGVRDALSAVRAVVAPHDVTILGQLVHNPDVTAELRSRGFAERAETDRDAVPATPQVLVTAHGVSDRRRQSLVDAGKTLIDTTCPLVRHVHEAAKRLHDDGRLVIVIGRADHVEVQGVVEDLVNYAVVESVSDVVTWPDERLGIVCQSTASADEVATLRGLIAARNPHAEIAFVDTICKPTKERQQALADLLPRVDAVVVVGGANSNNTRRLVERARAVGKLAIHVESAADLRAEWFAGCRTVGLTAGTSTLDHTIDEVRQKLESF
jgi:4-hydroxy-3-methylbut-2-enyl diphosphate reductase